MYDCTIISRCRTTYGGFLTTTIFLCKTTMVYETAMLSVGLTLLLCDVLCTTLILNVH